MISYVNVYSNILLSVLYLCSYVLTLDLESLNIHHAVKKYIVSSLNVIIKT